MSGSRVDTFLSRTTLRQVQIVAALQEHGTMSKAAEALGMSVANVSRASKRFETNLEIRLFEGNQRRYVLRSDAADVLDCFASIASQIDMLRNELEERLQSLTELGTGGKTEWL